MRYSPVRKEWMAALIATTTIAAMTMAPARAPTISRMRRTSSGKVKRLRHTPRVTLVPCDARGRVVAEAEPVEASAVVRDDEETRARLESALARKYGVKYRMLRASRKLTRTPDTSVPLVIS